MNGSTIIAIVLLLTGITMPSTAQKINQRYTDHKEKIHLIGKCERASLTEAPFDEWYNKYYKSYELDKELLTKSEGKLDDITIEIFMGTWCGDSKRGVPQFYKVMDHLKVKEGQISLINLYDSHKGYKQGPNHEEKGKLIHRVPTFIFYKEGKEIGRIVETPATSFEMDIAQIMHGLPPSPTYKIVPAVEKILLAEGVTNDRKALLKIAQRVYKSAEGDKALNTYGYVLLENNEIEKAIAVLTINSMIFSRNANTWDSLAEAYEKNKEFEKAFLHYEKALSINPGLKNAKKKVEELSKYKPVEKKKAEGKKTEQKKAKS